MKPRFSIKSGYYIAPSPIGTLSTILQHCTLTLTYCCSPMALCTAGYILQAKLPSLDTQPPPGSPSVTILLASSVRMLVYCVVKYSRPPDLKSSLNTCLLKYVIFELLSKSRNRLVDRCPDPGTRHNVFGFCHLATDRIRTHASSLKYVPFLFCYYYVYFMYGSPFTGFNVKCGTISCGVFSSKILTFTF